MKLSNRFAYLSSICEECELLQCACSSQFKATATFPLVTHNGDIQVLGSPSNISFSETVNMVTAKQLDTYYNCDNLHVSTSMRPSSSDTDNTFWASDSNLSNDTCVSYVSFSGADISVSNQTPTRTLL